MWTKILLWGCTYLIGLVVFLGSNPTLQNAPTITIMSPLYLLFEQNHLFSASVVIFPPRNLLEFCVFIMSANHLVAYFFGGIFALNFIPHIANGVSGRAFQTPFAKPPGVGLSSATVNVVWAFINALLAYVLLVKVGDFDVKNTQHAGVFAAGAFIAALLLSKHFGKFHGGNLVPEKKK